MLQINLDRLDRGESWKSAKLAFDLLNLKFKSFEVINNDPDFYIGQCFIVSYLFFNKLYGFLTFLVIIVKISINYFPVCLFRENISVSFNSNRNEMVYLNIV